VTNGADLPGTFRIIDDRPTERAACVACPPVRSMVPCSMFTVRSADAARCLTSRNHRLCSFAFVEPVKLKRLAPGKR